MNNSPALPDHVIPVILAGGPGLRLRPWSRPSRPKPFLRVHGQSLLQKTLARIGNRESLVLCNQNYANLAKAQADAAGARSRFLLEPVGRNTAPAIAIAAAWIMKNHGADKFMLVMPSDHDIRQPAILLRAVHELVPGMQDDQIISFGIRPRRPSTRFGYIVPGKPHTQFFEKPDRIRALRLLADGASWNSGIFLTSASTMAGLFSRLTPDLWRSAQQATENARADGAYTYFNPTAFAAMPSCAIDRAIMERTDCISCHTLDMRWRDLGTWPSMAAYLCGL